MYYPLIWLKALSRVSVKEVICLSSRSKISCTFLRTLLFRFWFIMLQVFLMTVVMLYDSSLVVRSGVKGKLLLERAIEEKEKEE